MSAPCGRCRGAGCVAVWHREGTAPRPYCQPEAGIGATLATLEQGEGAAILVDADGCAYVVRDAHVVLVAGVRVSRSRVEDLALVLSACAAHDLSAAEWLRQARAALGGG